MTPIFYLSGQLAPPDFYRDILNNLEITPGSETILPPDPDGQATCYVHLNPLFMRKKDEELPVETSVVKLSVVGACGRRPDQAPTRPVVTDTVKKPLPCAVCNRPCPNKVKASFANEMTLAASE